MSTPPGWPGDVRPPDAPGWAASATAWLLDLCPADYRGYGVLTRHPLALTYVAASHVDADLTALRAARATARGTLTEQLGAAVLTQMLEMFDLEEARLLAARRGVQLIDEALRGRRHVPRL